MKRNNRKIWSQIPWGGVAVILAAGILISAGIIWSRRPAASETQAPDGPVHTVTFLDQQGEILQESDVNHGSYAVPPELEAVESGIVFRSWSNLLYGIDRDMETRPVYQDLRESSNVFYLGGAYGQLGEQMEMELQLGGKVNLSSIELTLRYDPDVLKKFSCDTLDGPFEVRKKGRGYVVLELAADENLTESVTAAQLRFNIAKSCSDAEMTKILVEMKDPMKLEGGEKGTDSCAVHGEVYLLS